MTPLLVLLDMNGTLLYRAKHNLHARIPDQAPTPPRIDDAKVQYWYYVRPGTQKMVRSLAKLRGVTVAFYTSMQGRNAEPAVKYIAGKNWNKGEVPFLLFDRKYNKADPTGGNSWDTMRDLPKVRSKI
jgi:hypothetical protein